MRLPLYLCLILLLSACSSNTIKPNELVPLVAKLTVEKQWQRQIGVGPGAQYRVLSPEIVGDKLFVNDAKGEVFAYQKDTGDLIWRQRLSVNTAAGLGVGTDLVLAASLDGDVIALNIDTGETLWRTNLSSEILAPPQTNGTVVIVQANDGKLFGLNAQSGERIWDHSVPLPILTLRGTATPLLFGQDLVTGFSNGKLMAFSAVDGTLYWERRIARPQGRSDIERVVDIDSKPIIYKSTLYTTSYNGSLSALAPNGTILWSQQVSSHSSPIVIGGNIILTTNDGVVRAFDAKSGASLWENSSLFLRKLSAPQNINGFVAVADFEGYVHVLDPETGVILSRQQVDDAGVRSSMLASGDKLYVYGNNGVLVALSVLLADPENLQLQ